MKEGPIIFNTEMVRAILEGRKTQTRRVVKLQPDTSIWKKEAMGKPKEWRLIPLLGPGHHHQENMWGLYNKDDKASDLPYFGRKCPYGKVGDRLWLKETYKIKWSVEHGHGIECKADNKFKCFNGCCNGQPIEGYDWLVTKYSGDWRTEKWRHSIHMPKWASRITLEITDIRVERVQKITPNDCTKEGLKLGGLNINMDEYFKSNIYTSGLGSETFAFMKLWNSINAKPKPRSRNGKITHYDSYPWDEASADKRASINGVPHHCYPNPWAWPISFKKVG